MFDYRGLGQSGATLPPDSRIGADAAIDGASSLAYAKPATLAGAAQQSIMR